MNPTASENGASDRTRTCNLLIRSQSTHNPTESQNDSSAQLQALTPRNSPPQPHPITAPLTLALTLAALVLLLAGCKGVDLSPDNPWKHVEQYHRTNQPPITVQ